MKPFAGFITEIFERPYRFSNKRTIGSGIAIGSMIFSAQVKGGQLDIEISKISHEAWGVDFTVDGMYDLTGAGEPTKILATVFEAVKEFIQVYSEAWGEPPVEFQMKANKAEGSRTTVYRALVRRFGAEYGYRVKEVRVWEPFAGSETAKFDVIVVRREK